MTRNAKGRDKKQERAFREFVAEMVAYLAFHLRSSRKAEAVAEKAWSRMVRLAHRTGDQNAYLLRIARILALDKRHLHKRE